MKKRAFILGLILSGTFLLTVEGLSIVGVKQAKKIAITEAECGWCGTMKCLNSSICLGDCVCVSDGINFGSCVSVSHVEEMPEGFSILP